MASLGAPIVGREHEISALHTRARAIAAGADGGLVVVEGEPGIGKTRLVDEACARSTSLGVVVARGAALADAGAPALTAWRAVARAMDAATRRAFEPSADAASSPDEARWRRFSAIGEALAAFARRKPLWVVLDDLHDADAESIELLAFLVRDLRTSPLLFTATIRDRATRDAGAREATLVRVLRDASVIRLGPLRDADVGAMVQHAGRAELAARIFGASRGNPLFVTELLTLARSGGDIGSAQVPASIAGALRARMLGLDDAERDALELAAVLGAEVQLPLAARALGTTPEVALSSFARAIRMGLLADDGSLRLRFAHPLFRETIEGDLEPARRRALHARVAGGMRAALVSGQDVPAAEVAHHLASALPIGSADEALVWLERAAQDAERRLSFEEVVAIARRAVDVARAAALAATRLCDLELALARACSRAGARGEAREAAMRAMGLARGAGDAMRMTYAALARGADFSLGVVDGGLVADLEAALERIGEAAPTWRARLEARLAAARQPAPDPQVPVALAREAIARARATGDREAMLEVLMSAGSALADYAPVEERRALAAEMHALAVALDRRTLALRATLRLAIDSVELGDLDAADRAIEEHARLAASLGAPHHRWTAPVLRAMRAAMRGDRLAVDAHHAEARALAERAEDPNAPIAITHQRAVFCVEWLDPATLTEAVEHVNELSREMAGASIVIGLLRAWVHARRGDADRARALDPPLEHPMVRGDEQLSALACEVVAIAMPERAADWVERAAAGGERVVMWGPFAPGWAGPWSRLHGLLLRALGDRDAALAELERARTRSVALGARPFVVRLDVEIAETLEARGADGDRARAAALRAEAGTSARALGMEACAAQAERGGAPTPSARAPLVVPRLPFTLARDGEVWVLMRDARTHRLKDSRGLRWLARLLAEPDRDFHVLELAGGEGADGGDAGELLDARAIGAYRARATALREALEEAEANGDLGRIEGARAELDALTGEIARSVGLGDRSRRAAGAVERARVNVQRRLKDATGRIASLDPELGKHLEWALRTGTLCRYRTR